MRITRVLPCAMLLMGLTATAQSRFAAVRQTQVQVGVGAAYLRPDYAQGGVKTISPYISMDFRKHHLGAEVQGNIAVSGATNIREHSLLFGPRIYQDWKKARFYAKPAIGWGHFSGDPTQPAVNGSSFFVVEVGGGVDYRVTDHVNLRGFAANQWYTGFQPNTPRSGGGLSPFYGGGGVAYRF